MAGSRVMEPESTCSFHTCTAAHTRQLLYLLHISTAFNVVAISDSSASYISTSSDASVSKTDRQPFCCSRRPATAQSRCDVGSTVQTSRSNFAALTMARQCFRRRSLRGKTVERRRSAKSGYS